MIQISGIFRFYTVTCFSPISCRFARVGSIVLALHDASDVFLEVGKMSKYSGAENIASFAFVLFILCWTLLRLMYYPFWVLWSTRFVYIYILFLWTLISEWPLRIEPVHLHLMASKAETFIITLGKAPFEREKK
jgi:hypothetical protein